MILAYNLQRLRKEKGLSQEKLAESVGVSRQAISKWESGQSYPEMDKLVLLSEIFGVSIDFLVKGGDSEEKRGNRQPEYGCFTPSFHFEYKSKKTLFQLPLVHINIGSGIRVAKGIVAIGNIAVGVLSLGVLSFGGLCIGPLGIGLASLAGIALGLFAAGGIAAGIVAAGGVALGIISIGGAAIGMFSLGGCAIASHIAIGGFANGHIAIGQTANGIKTIAVQNHNFRSIPPQQVRNLIEQEYPHLYKPITDWIVSFFS